jgi:hypothetical protein
MKHSVVDVTELQWGFDGDGPHVLVGGHGKYKRQEKVDPCPCYAHNAVYVETVLAQVTEKFDIDFPVVINVLHHETVGRTNGYMSYESDYDDESKPKRFFPYIVLLGKRIPLHPAMTRYLVSHEYGHVVEEWINYKRGKESHESRKETTLYKEYCELRGIGPLDHYGPGTWHKSMGEIFANDFRIAVCGIENEFWPHDVIYPLLDPNVVEWWSNAVKQYATQGIVCDVKQ